MLLELGVELTPALQSRRSKPDCSSTLHHSNSWIAWTTPSSPPALEVSTSDTAENAARSRACSTHGGHGAHGGEADETRSTPEREQACDRSRGRPLAAWKRARGACLVCRQQCTIAGSAASGTQQPPERGRAADGRADGRARCSVFLCSVPDRPRCASRITGRCCRRWRSSSRTWRRRQRRQTRRRARPRGAAAAASALRSRSGTRLQCACVCVHWALEEA